MGKSDTTLIAVGGGEMTEAEDVLKEFLAPLKKKPNATLIVMTVATNDHPFAARKYNRLFHRLGIGKVQAIDVSERDDAFSEQAVEKVRKADALFFTGGDQLNVTSLLGGTPLHQIIRDRLAEGFIVTGTSAGAMMMSNGMIISGNGDHAPQVGAIEIAPGMDLLPETMIDAHFSQRGRHGRLLAAIAHYPQDLGIGIDERTAIVVKGSEFKVVGKGAVTIIDGSKMRHTDLPYRKQDEPVGMFGVQVHVLPAGYKFSLASREPFAPVMKKTARANSEG